MLGLIGQIVKFAVVAGLIAAAVGLGYLGAAIYGQLQDLPDITLVERYEPIEAIQIYDRNDRMVCTVEGDEDRRVIPLTQVSTQMQQAMLAAEDHHFYEHNGINFLSIIRAAQTNLKAGHVVQGGSTITQQLVKNLFFSESGRTVDRKVKEAFMAYKLENEYSKERILEMYLNQIYFGNNAYGIERAAKRYFNKRAAELSLAESSFLAGLVKAPSELGAAANRAKAKDRQKEILDRMVEFGYVTQKQAEEAKKVKLVFKEGRNPLQKYPYYISYVMELLRDRFSQAELRRQGLRVYTNLDPVAQELGEKTLNEQIKKAPKGVSQGALVSVLVQDGSVVSLVGGVGNFWENQFNRATHPHTAGSSFKPFVYLTAFLQGKYTPETLIEDTPLVVKQKWGLPDYKPQNFDHKFMGKIPVRTALKLSRNIPSVRTAQLVGVDSIVETARRAGVTAKLDPNLSLALGSSAISPLDLAGAYATFARMGVQIQPQVLRRIENNRGQIIEVFEAKVDRVFPVEPVARLVSILQDVVQHGTGTKARLKDRPVAGKTGTADEGRDIWFMGFTPDMVTAVWAGNDENKPVKGRNITGGGLMAPIWGQYMTAYYAARPHPAGSFVAPTPSVAEDRPAPEPELTPTQLAELEGGGGDDSSSKQEATPAKPTLEEQTANTSQPEREQQQVPIDPLLGGGGFRSETSTSSAYTRDWRTEKPAPSPANQSYGQGQTNAQNLQNERDMTPQPAPALRRQPPRQAPVPAGGGGGTFETAGDEHIPDF